MSIFARYISRRFVAYFILMLVGLASLALTLDLMEEADRVLESDRGGIFGLLLYSALRLPDIVAQMLPIATLLGMLVALAQLLRHSELVALWASGVSPAGMMKALLPAVLILGVFTLINNDYMVPETRIALREWGVGDARKSGIFSDDAKVAWLRSGPDIVRTPKKAAASGAVRDVIIFRRDDSGRLLERLDAALAKPDGDGWMLFGVTRHRIDPAVVEQQDRLYWNGRIALSALPLIASDMRELRITDLVRLIEEDGYGQRPGERYRTWLHARVASLLLPALMVYLCLALAQRFRRTGAFSTLLLSSLAIGFAYFALDGVCLSLGESGLLSSLVAAWSPKLALACLIGSFVVLREA